MTQKFLNTSFVLHEILYFQGQKRESNCYPYNSLVEFLKMRMFGHFG